MSDEIKSLVIQQWLQAIFCIAISLLGGLSSEAVTNIVNEWRRALGFALANALKATGNDEKGWHYNRSMRLGY
jgi:hypothetical protein